jgi:hypothetical protein
VWLSAAALFQIRREEYAENILRSARGGQVTFWFLSPLINSANLCCLKALSINHMWNYSNRTILNNYSTANLYGVENAMQLIDTGSKY